MKTDKVNDNFYMNQYQAESKYWDDLFLGDFNKTSIRPDFSNVVKSKIKLDVLNFTIEGKVFERLSWIANESDYRLFVILLANYFTLLRHYCNSNKITVGTTIYKQDIEADFINTILPLKIDFHLIKTFKELLVQVRNNVSNAVEHQNYPMHKLMKDLEVEETKFDFPLFDLFILLKNIQKTEYITNNNIGIKFIFERLDNKIDAVIEFDSNKYSIDTITRLKDHYLYLMEININNVDLEIRNTELISQKEKNLINNTFNNTIRPLKPYNSIIEWFEMVANEFPHNNVLSYVDITNGIDKHLTYSELQDKTSRLAKYLNVQGVTKNTLVGVFCKQDFYQVISILAILKAGGAYVPIDKTLPEARVRFILNDCNCKYLVTEDSLFKQFNYLETIFKPEQITLLNSEEVYQQKLDKMFEYDKNDLAYIIYTSGSTGIPKGVAINNLGIINYTSWRFETHNYKKEDATLQLLSYAFDGYNSNFYSSIISGGQLILLPEYDVLDGGKLLQVIQKYKVTNLSAIPRIFEVILNSDQDECALESLRFVVFAGEKANGGTIKSLREFYPNVKVYNEYGPTEATVTIACNNDLRSEDTDIVGTPIDNIKISILNKDGKQTPFFLPGEICCQGFGISRGYLNNPEETNKSFITSNGESSIYRTGDIGYLDFNGQIHLIGRDDDQVKIRGFRIEVEEIEKILRRHKEILEAVVVIHSLSDDEKQLHAFYVSRNSKEVTDIPEFLETYLPEYMVPVSFTKVSSMQYTLSGKIDKKRLSIPVNYLGKSFKKPATLTQRKLAEVWGDVLNKPIEQIGIQSNFFEMGGHSLNATFVISKIQKVFDIKIPMVDVFEHPVIEILAEKIESKIKEKYEPIPKAIEKSYYSLTSAQKRFYFLQESNKESISYNIPVVLKIQGKINLQKVEEVFNTIVRKHCSLRTIFQLQDNIPVQKVKSSLNVKVDYIKESSKSIDEIKEQFIKPFDLTDAPLFRLAIAEDNKGDKFFLFDMHHIITDALSMQILTNEFIQLYSGNTIFDSPIDYIDYIEFLEMEDQSKRDEQQKVFWMSYLSGQLPRLNLPIDNKRIGGINYSGKSIRFELATELSQKLRKIAKEKEVTLFMLTLAIFKVFLYRITKIEDLIIGTPVSGRQHPDVEHIVGLFINTLIIRSKIQEEISFYDFLLSIKSNTLKAFDNQDYDFSDIVEHLDIDRTTDRNLLFDVLFVFDNFKLDSLKCHEFELIPQDYHSISSKLDLTCMVLSEKDDIQIIFEYNDQLFEKETIELFRDQFLQLTADICDKPDKMINDYSIKYSIPITSEEDIDFDL